MESMSKDDAPYFRHDEAGTCEDCKHLEWKYPKEDELLVEAVCNLYNFCVPSPVSFYKCNSWELDT
jgi:hypothetical protein